MMNVNMFIHPDFRQCALPMIGTSMGIAGIRSLYENRREWYNVGRAAIAPATAFCKAAFSGASVISIVLVALSVYENTKPKAY
jgi:hypothetical protein